MADFDKVHEEAKFIESIKKNRLRDRIDVTPGIVVKPVSYPLPIEDLDDLDDLASKLLPRDVSSGLAPIRLLT
jgi:hypothetical protein